jgi:hypothetical protein
MTDGDAFLAQQTARADEFFALAPGANAERRHFIDLAMAADDRDIANGDIGWAAAPHAEMFDRSIAQAGQVPGSVPPELVERWRA